MAVTTIGLTFPKEPAAGSKPAPAATPAKETKEPAKRGAKK